ncbi:hypothetical protein YC2023_022812 [Brassica napus]
MPDDDGHKQCSTDVVVQERLLKQVHVEEWEPDYKCSTDVIVKERLGKFEAVQVLMLVLGGGTTDVVAQELVTKYEAVRHC